MTPAVRRTLEERLVALARPVGWLAVLGWLAWIAVALRSGALFRPGWIGVLVVIGIAALLLVAWADSRRRAVIRERILPRNVRRRVAEANPGWAPKDLDLVERGFRQFFLASARSGRKRVAMPSKAVDAYWHAFLLDTVGYADWCRRTLGRFLHHLPAERMGSDATVNDALRRCWYHACREESINPRKPSRLPLLFALDTKLGIAGGVSYLPSRRDLARREREGVGSGDASVSWSFGSDFSDDAVAGDADGMGGADVGGGDGGGGDGGGDGGGCGGGGD